MDRMDIYERKPAGMENYLANYGWHFSKKMAEWAISMMRDRNGAKVSIQDKATLEETMKANGIKTDTVKGYDLVYVIAMAKSDFYGNSITSDVQLYKFVNDYINDKDGYDGMPFTRFYADCLAKGEPILWEEMM